MSLIIDFIRTSTFLFVVSCDRSRRAERGAF